ncbi:hypothetical protein TNCV_1554851 [Trichonephila clavipes]|nr:hypothetical protein TNCV_1554851 [Trichonephila clavipes]
MRSARYQSPSLSIDVLGISLRRVPHVEAWRVGCHLSSPPGHSTGVPNDTICMCLELVTLPIVKGVHHVISLRNQKTNS